MATLAHFQITRAHHTTIVQILVSGELDHASAPHLAHHIRRAQHTNTDTIVIDLTAVTYIDASGLHALLTAHHNDNQRLRIILNPTTAHHIDHTGLRNTLPIIEG